MVLSELWKKLRSGGQAIVIVKLRLQEWYSWWELWETDYGKLKLIVTGKRGYTNWSLVTGGDEAGMGVDSESCSCSLTKSWAVVPF